MNKDPNSENLLFHNGRIYTQVPEDPFYQAVGIQGGKIVWLGMDDELYQLPPDKFKIINLNGKCVLPSFFEAHMNYAFWAWSLGHIDLSGCKSYEETLRAIKSSSQKLGRGDWLIGQGWLKDGWENPVWPHKKDLDKIWILRKFLNEKPLIEAMEFLLEKLGKTKTNSHFLKSMNT